MGQFDAPAAVKKGKCPNYTLSRGLEGTLSRSGFIFFQFCFWRIKKFLALLGQEAKFHMRVDL
jgi:hypothetical protein